MQAQAQTKAAAPTIPQVLKQETDKFAKVWRYNGLFINLDPAHIQFATDFANVVLRNFIQQCQAQVAAAIQAQAKEVPAEHKGKLIIEG